MSDEEREHEEYPCRVCSARVIWTASPAQVAAGLCSTCHHSAEHGWVEPDEARRLRAERDEAIRQAQQFSADADEMERERDELRAVLEQARAALIAIRDPFWVPPNVVEEIDRHLGAIEVAVGEQST